MANAETAGLIALALATLLGAFVQAATGFGFALLAAPIYLSAMGSTSAMAVLVAVHVVQSVMLVPRLWRSAERGLLVALIAGAALGMPAGLAILDRLDLATLKLTVGAVMLVFTAMLALRELGLLQSLAALGRDPRARLPVYPGIVGLLAGLLTALLVMPGPPLILYAAILGLAKVPARALSLTFFAVCYVTVTAMQAAAGALGPAEWRLIGLLAPVVVLGTLAGERLAKGLSEERFRWAVLAISFISGLYALWSAL